jgi:3-methyl-2-oxobutanoate hydroxymethyltransferase
VQRYADILDEMVAGVEAFASDVRTRRYPSPDHGYSIPDEELAAFRQTLREQ